MNLFYIENTVNEIRSTVRGYFSTLEKAQEALKDCCDWYDKKGTGEIYQIDVDVLNAEPILVCKNGSLITPSNELSEAMKKVFSEMSAFALTEWYGSYHSFHYYISQNPRSSSIVSELKEHISDNAFRLCFYNTKKECEEKKQISSVNSLIVRATAISEQSKGLADDLGKLRDGFEMTD